MLHRYAGGADKHVHTCRVDKAHFSMKYDLKTFMEAEFARRNLFKQVTKDTGGGSE